VIGGEVTSLGQVDAEQIARRIYREIGYSDELRVVTNITQQSPDISQGVDTGGAGDQGIMYGFATNETPEYLPRAVVLAHKLSSGLEKLRRSGKLPWLGPDGKTQVTVQNGNLKTIVVSTQHSEEVGQDMIREELVKELITPLVKELDGIDVLVNPTGKFTIGGFEADTGLTGRKIMVDTYGGLIPHGGGCFSGKDPTKVDRSAAYMARFAAKNIVAQGLAGQCLVSVAYAIGQAEPVMVSAVDGQGNELSKAVLDQYDFRPLAILDRLSLRHPIYQQTAAYGHFGKEGLPWEGV
jgi:S-adenosylmethionine synthetase